MTPPNLDELKAALDYDPSTGIFLWKVSAGGRKIGTRAGHVARDYRTPNSRSFRLRFQGRCYTASYIAWYMTTGEWPDGITYLDNNPKNLRLRNLQPKTKEANDG